MHRTARRLAASALIALGLALLAPQGQSARAAEGDVPTATQASDEPVKVMVGAYINDIQQLDFKTNNYAVDLYVCMGAPRSGLEWEEGCHEDD